MANKINLFINQNKILILIFLFGLVLRLWHINNPLLDEHKWRQTGSGVVAMNYMTNTNFFQPTTNFDYRYPMAYGLFEYIVGISAKLVGFSDILGRLIALSIFLIGFFYFYLLVKKFWGQNIALWACAFYSFLPVSVFYSRSFQPDGSMVSVGIIFLYYFILWVDTRKLLYFITIIILANLTFLFKIPSLMLLIPAFGYLFINEKYKAFLNWKWYVFVILSVSFPLFFHYYVPIATNGKIMSAFFEQDKWGGAPIWLSFEYWFKTFYLNLFEYHYMHTGYIFLILGIFKKIHKKENWFFYFWLAAIILYFIFVAKGMHHEYYSLPLMPLACIFIGRFLSSFYDTAKERWTISRKNRIIIILVSFMVLYSFVFSLIRLKDRYTISAGYLEIAQIVKQNSNPNDHVIVMSKSEPEVLYYSNRKGVNTWTYEQLAGCLNKNIKEYKILAVVAFPIKKDNNKLYNYIKNKYNIIFEEKSGLVAILN